MGRGVKRRREGGGSLVCNVMTECYVWVVGFVCEVGPSLLSSWWGSHEEGGPWISEVQVHPPCTTLYLFLLFGVGLMGEMRICVNIIGSEKKESERHVMVILSNNKFLPYPSSHLSPLPSLSY